MFLPKNYIRLEQAMSRAGLLVVKGWTGNELNSLSTNSFEDARRNELVAWFRRELHAESFICSYWSTGKELTNVPPSVFGLDDSERLFGPGKALEGQSSAHDLTLLPDGTVDLRARGITWIDALSPWYQLELAVGKELYISEMGLNTALKELEDVQTKIIEDSRRLTSVRPLKTRAVKGSALASWMSKRVDGWPSSEPPPTEKSDLEAARAEFPNISREQLRSARKQHAPPEWLKQGRRPKKR